MTEGMAYGAKGYHLLGGETVNLMMHAVSDERGAPLPGALKVARFSFYPQSGGAAGDLAKNSKAFCSRNQIEPSRFNGLITVLHCRNEHDKGIVWQQTIGREGAEELRDTLKDFPLGTIQYAGLGTEKCWKREHWNGEWNAKAEVIMDIIKEQAPLL